MSARTAVGCTVPQRFVVLAHRHPCEEVFVVQEGSATYTAGDDRGERWVVPAGLAHKFVNSGTGRLWQVDIRASDRFVTEWLED